MFICCQAIRRIRLCLTVSLLLVVALVGATRPTQAEARPAGRSEPPAVTQFAAPARTPTVSGSIPYRVVSGDTLTGIARQLRVPGGWRAVYALNRSIIGTDPNRLLPGSLLAIPAVSSARDQPSTRSVHYVTASGDTLTRIARRLEVRGGWPALYALNRSKVGGDPNRLLPGVQLTIPVAPAARHVKTPTVTTSKSSSTASPRPDATAQSGAPAAPAPSVAATAAASVPLTPARSAGIPGWLQAMLLLAGVMVVLFLFGEPAVVALGRVRPATVRRMRGRRMRVWAARGRRRESEPWMTTSASTCPTQVPQREDVNAQTSASVLLADHDRLIVTSVPGRGVIVLRPPGQAIEEILRVARVVLTEPEYHVLAQRLTTGNKSEAPQRSVANGLRSKLRPERRHTFGALHGPVR